MKSKTVALPNAEPIYRLFDEYRNAYTAEWERLEKCQRIYRGEHWYGVPENDPGEPRPVTPVIQSTIENVRADLMDQFPQAVITADEPQYGEIAELITAAIKENHLRTGYAREYAKLTHDLLVGGYMVQEVGFDPALNNGLGGAFLRHVDPRSIMFDPLCADIADSRAVFKFVSHPRAWFKQRYPKQEQDMNADSLLLKPVHDSYLTVSDNDSIMLIECWQREYDPDTGRYSIHMTKFAGGVVLENSRTAKPEGYYRHGEYPFVVTTLFPRKGSCLGFGFVDMFENQQLYSDKLDQIVLKNALMASHNKLLVTGASGFDVDDLRDWSKEVHRGENLNGVTWFSTAPLPGYIISYIQSMREGIKEESGANDFSRGSTSGGVTAASAIAALQEMSSKRSRMAARSVHSAFEQAVRQEIEVEREFCIFPRKLYSVGKAKKSGVLTSSDLMKKTGLGNDLPIEFSVTVKVQRENSFSVAAHNELMLAMLKAGMITPDIALEMMMFDGKEQVQELMNKKLEEAKAAKAEEEKGKDKAEDIPVESDGPIAQEIKASKGNG